MAVIQNDFLIFCLGALTSDTGVSKFRGGGGKEHLIT